MNWYKAKTILIVFFICMNVFLLANLIYSARQSSIVTPEIISSTVDVLSRNDIEINPELIPQKTVSMKSFEMKNAVSDKNTLSKSLCGGSTTQVSDNTYSGAEGTVVFSGDKFSFTASERCTLNTAGDIKAFVTELMKRSDIDLSSAQYSETVDANGTTAYFTNVINGYRIFDSCVTASASPDGKLLSVSGIWFCEPSSVSGTLPLKSITGILIDFILEPNRPKEKNTIMSLELGYTASDADIYHETTVLVPVWQIKLSDGSTYCIDTRE